MDTVEFRKAAKEAIDQSKCLPSLVSCRCQLCPSPAIVACNCQPTRNSLTSAAMEMPVLASDAPANRPVCIFAMGLEPAS